MTAWHDDAYLDLLRTAGLTTITRPDEVEWPVSETFTGKLYALLAEKNVPDSLSAKPIKGIQPLDIPRIFTISESAHRIHNPFTPEKIRRSWPRAANEGRNPDTRPWQRFGEMLCTWARDRGIRGIGVDMSALFSEQAKLRAEELGVADRVTFIHQDAAGYVAEEKCDIAACVGATWIAGGVAGTIELLSKSLKPGGMLLIGEPYWRQVPATEEIAGLWRLFARRLSDACRSGLLLRCAWL